MLTHSDFLVEISTDPLNSLFNCFLSCQWCGNCGVVRELIHFCGQPWCQRQWQRVGAPGLAIGCSWQGRFIARLCFWENGFTYERSLGVWGSHPTFSVFLLGCVSPDAKGTSPCCRFHLFSLHSQRCLQMAWISKKAVLPPLKEQLLKCCIFLLLFWVFWANVVRLYTSVPYLECTFILATIIVSPPKDHIFVFSLFSRGLPFS